MTHSMPIIHRKVTLNRFSVKKTRIICIRSQIFCFCWGTVRVLTVELTAHHRDLEAFEVVFHELLTVAASVGPGAVK